MSHRDRQWWRRGITGGVTVATLALLLTGCDGGSYAAPGPSVGSATPAAKAPGKPLPARVGRPARSSRIRFVPETLALPGGAAAPVRPAQTVDGELAVPEEVRHVGWWDGSAYAGDPYGSTVIAGHLDSATEGLGFFVRLRRVQVGQRVTLRGGGHSAAYRVVSVQTVAKRALATDSRAFDQSGPHRLVLITCAGAYHRERGGYDSNLVVTAAPIGLAR